MNIIERETIFEPVSAEFVEKKSRFIGSLSPVTSVAEAMAFVALVAKQNSSATHNVWAYLLLDEQGILQKRYSDDGEPQGTAGVPCLDVLEKSGLCGVCVVATRYFGGILLGGSGLCRAYSHTASIAVAAARRRQLYRVNRIELQCGYDFYDKLLRFIAKGDVVTENVLFEEAVTMTLLLKTQDYSAFCEALISLSNGRIIPALKETLLHDMNKNSLQG